MQYLAIYLYMMAVGFVVAGLCYVYIAWYGLSFRSLDKPTARAA